MRGIRRAVRDRGQAVVEFALLLPVLIVLIMGVIDIARAYNVLQVVTNAAREGARVAILPSSTSTTVTTTVDTYLTAAGQTGCNSSGSNWGTAGAAGDSTTVTVSCTFDTLTGTLIPGWTGSFALAQTATMRHE
ncbi:MAG: TadE family protein [bacterium]